MFLVNLTLHSEWFQAILITTGLFVLNFLVYFLCFKDHDCKL
jgi:hypothetical protein